MSRLLSPYAARETRGEKKPHIVILERGIDPGFTSDLVIITGCTHDCRKQSEIPSC